MGLCTFIEIEMFIWQPPEIVIIQTGRLKCHWILVNRVYLFRTTLIMMLTIACIRIINTVIEISIRLW